MQINEDGSVTLDFNATLEVAREFHKKYTRYNRKYLWYKKWADQNQGKADQVKWFERYSKTAEIARKQAKVYEKWETLYQLLLKNKRMHKQTTVECERGVSESTNKTKSEDNENS